MHTNKSRPFTVPNDILLMIFDIYENDNDHLWEKKNHTAYFKLFLL